MTPEYYVWPASELAIAQSALEHLNHNPRLPIVGINAETGELKTENAKTEIWVEEVQIFVNDTVGFARLPESLLDYMMVPQEERQAWLAAFHPQILPFDPAWLPPVDEQSLIG